MAKPATKEDLDKIKLWEKNGEEISRTFVCANFTDALFFVNKVGEIAEDMDHHPDIFIHQYKKVRLTLSTHSAKALTRLDVDQAQKIDALWNTSQGLTT